MSDSKGPAAQSDNPFFGSYTPAAPSLDIPRDLDRSVSPCEVPVDTIDTADEYQNDLIMATSKNPIAVMELDLDCNVQYLSKNWEVIVGTKRNKIIGRPSSTIVLGDESDAKVFNRAVDIMMVDDTSYRVKFLVSTNARREERQDESSEEESIDTNSEISTDGGVIELEGQGILIHDNATKKPTHSMWILKPFVPIKEVALEIPEELILNLGFGVNILESYLLQLMDEGIIDEEAVPPPTTELCRICDQMVPSWWLEKHSELCVLEYRSESMVQLKHDILQDHRKLIVSIMESIQQQNLSPPSSPKPFSSPSSSSSSSSSSLITEYKGFPLPTVGSSVSGESSAKGSPLIRRVHHSSVFNKRFPFKNFEMLLEYCDEALSVNPGELVQKDEDYVIAYSPHTQECYKKLLEVELPESNDPAIKLLTEDAQHFAQDKLDAISRYGSALQYSFKLNKEIDALVLQTVQNTVKKIRERTNDYSAIVTDEEEPVSRSATPLPEIAETKLQSPKPINRTTRPIGVSGDVFETPDYRKHLSSNSTTPRNESGQSSGSGSRVHTPLILETPEEPTSSLRGRALKSTGNPTHYPSPRRQLSPAPNYFQQSPMTSIQRNSKLPQNYRGSTSGTSTPIASPLLLSSDYHQSGSQDYGLLLPPGHGSGSFSSSTKAPLSPLLVSTSLSKPNFPSQKDYDVIKPISKGAFGSVFLVRRKVTGEYFAMKVLKKSDMIAKNQVTNVRAERDIMISQEESPYVAKLYSSFQTKDYLYLVMEYLSGGDCAALVKNMGTLPEVWAKRYIAEVIVGIDDLHNKGVVHRDLKPDNLLIDSSGHLKLTDFGLSRMGLVGRQTRRSVITSGSDSVIQDPFKRSLSTVTPFSLTPATDAVHHRTISNTDNYSDGSAHSPISAFAESSLLRSNSMASSTDSPVLRPFVQGSTSSPDDSNPSNYVLFDPRHSAQSRKFVGTPDYLAPETVQGIAQDEVSDWWSIGCIMFEFLFGYPPFSDDTPERVFENILHGEIQWPNLSLAEFREYCSDLARDLITKLLDKNPETRLGVHGSQEIMNHPYFHGLNWSALFVEEASFVPNQEDPESTDYFDPRGADMKIFPQEEDDTITAQEYDVYEEEADDEQEERKRSSGSGSGSAVVGRVRSGSANTRSNSSSSSATIGSNSPAAKLIIPRERRGSRLNESNSEFGSFNYKNVSALQKANNDVITRLRTEHLEHRGSFSSVTSSNSDSGSGNQAYQSPQQQPRRSLKNYTSPTSSIPPKGIISSSSSKPITPSTPTGPGSPSVRFHNPLSDEHTDSGRYSPLMLSKSEYGSPISKPIKISGSKANQYLSVGPQILLSDTPKGIARGLNRTLSDFSPSGSDTEDFKNSALMRVNLRRNSRRVRTSSSTSDAKAVLIAMDVLVCEPIPIVRYSIEANLKRLGCDVVPTSSPDEMIRAATGGVKFDVIFTALKLPNLDSVDVVKLIKHTSSINSDTPIVAITAFSSEAQNAGVFDDVIEKPATVSVLKKCLTKLRKQRELNNQEAISDSELSGAESKREQIS